MFISEQYLPIWYMDGEFWDELSYQAYRMNPDAYITQDAMMDAMLFHIGL